MDVAVSVNGVPIRLTAERWTHIVENHDDLAGHLDDVLGAISDPAWVTPGRQGSLVAWASAGRRRFLAVCYREVSPADGFVITAYFTGKPMKAPKLWP